ncbi:MAG: nucleoside monophosphate kinase [Candidatus Aminicenantes bacterium]|nr:nucleoside monophosphate kinase [Candidatus Aminicenantes bacterium]
MDNKKAILLVGPTGAGKTPLGELLECRGFRGRRCLHFDFGANLRAIAASFEAVIAGERQDDAFSARERAVILDSLAGGALLENENFPIAEKILDRFVHEKGVGRDDLLIMNGLPRHPGQARDLERSTEVCAVVNLIGTAAVIKERIRLDTGGDRAGRSDDSLEAVERKLEIFEKRTLPLLEFYAARRVPILKIPVGAGTTAEEVLADLERRL